MKISKFEELDCWKAGRELTKLIYKATRSKEFSKDFGLRDQIQRAAISVTANIAEGFASYSNLEFIRFLDYSARSAVEVESHLYAALDLEYISKEDFIALYGKASDCVNLCKGFIRYLKEKT